MPQSLSLKALQTLSWVKTQTFRTDSEGALKQTRMCLSSPGQVASELPVNLGGLSASRDPQSSWLHLKRAKCQAAHTLFSLVLSNNPRSFSACFDLRRPHGSYFLLTPSGFCTSSLLQLLSTKYYGLPLPILEFLWTLLLTYSLPAKQWHELKVGWRIWL